MSSPSISEISSKQSSGVGTKKTKDTNFMKSAASGQDVAATELSEEEIKKQQKATQQQLFDKAITEAIRGTGLSLEEAKKMLTALNLGNNEIDKTNLNNVLNCLKYAIKDCAENGKLDKEKLKNTFGCYALLCLKTGKMTPEQTHKFLNLSLMGMIIARNPALAKKQNITAEDIVATIKPLIDGQLTDAKRKKRPEQVKELLRSMFATGLSKCSPKETKLLTEAFIILLKDNDLKDEIDTIVSEVCNNLKDNPKLLNKFINTTLADLLKKYGFDDKTIQKICSSSLGKFLAENPEAFKTLIKGGIEFLASLKDSTDLPILLKVLNKQLNHQLDSLTNDEIAVLNKYQAEIKGLLDIYAQIANNPELGKMFNNLMQELNSLVGELKLSDYIFNSIQALFEQNPDLFNNISKDDLVKRLNEVTNNKYGETVGDTNPENLYKGNTAIETTDAKQTVGFNQRSSAQEASSAAENIQAMQIEEEDKSKITIDTGNNQQNKKSFFETFAATFVKSDALKNIDTFNRGLAEGLISMKEAGKDFNNAAESIQMKVITYLKEHKNNRTDYLNGCNNGALYLAAAENNLIGSIELKKLNASSDVRTLLWEMIDKKDGNKDERKFGLG